MSDRSDLTVGGEKSKQRKAGKSKHSSDTHRSAETPINYNDEEESIKKSSDSEREEESSVVKSTTEEGLEEVLDESFGTGEKRERSGKKNVELEEKRKQIERKRERRKEHHHPNYIATSTTTTACYKRGSEGWTHKQKEGDRQFNDNAHELSRQRRQAAEESTRRARGDERKGRGQQRPKANLS